MKPQLYRQVIGCEAERDQAIRTLKARNLDKPQLLTIAEYVPDHSAAQQRFYRVICRELSDHIGEDVDRTTHNLKRKFLVPMLWGDPTKPKFHKMVRYAQTIEEQLGRDPAERLRKMVVDQLSTKELNQGQMSKFIDRCLQEAAECGLPIETPDELRQRAKTTTRKKP